MCLHELAKISSHLRTIKKHSDQNMIQLLHRIRDQKNQPFKIKKDWF